MAETAAAAAGRTVGRYVLYGEIAAGGMATIHLGRVNGPVGFSRAVAIKRLHAQYAKDPEFVAMFLDEARLAGRIRHPNVVPTLDVVTTDNEIFLVMDYVQGESLARLARAMRSRQAQIPKEITAAIVGDVLHGLHAAHEVKDERGEPLGIVHRDVSPQNVLVGSDGIARLLDFGIAKAAGRLQSTRDGQIKGKIGYMAPEHLRGAPTTRQCDVYAASVMLWELFAGRRLFEGDNDAIILGKVLEGKVEPPSRHNPALWQGVDAVVMRGLSSEPARRFATAQEMATALELCVRPAPPAEVGAWVESLASEVLNKRAALVSEVESSVAVNLALDAQAVLAGLATERPLPPRNEPATQSASISVMRPSAVTLNEPRQRGRGGKLAVLVVGAAVLVTAGLVFLGVGVRDRFVASPTHTAAQAPTGEPVAPPVVAPPAPPLPTAAPSAATSVAVPLPTVTVATSATVLPKPVHTAPPKPLPVAPPTPPKNDCDPPYTWDKDGHKIYKVHCL
jgi:serine/threonine protein kinase